MIRPCRTAIYRTSVGVLLAAVCIAVAVAPRSAGAATAGEALLEPTPLILKDGRIAKVSVHVVPFQPGGTEVAPAAAGELAGLTRAVATDCFLTAQVIGHVGPTEVAENDSLGAHRLARSRADAVQASLIGGGLPAKSIASVWDWQFMVPEPRATLWVFRLTEGEDCDGTPLDSAASSLVAQDRAEPPVEATPRASQAPTNTAATDRAQQPVPAPAQAADRQPRPQQVARREQAEAPAARPQAAPPAARQAQAVPAGPASAKAARPGETREVPAASPAQSPAETQASRPPQMPSPDPTTVARATPATTPTPRATRPAATPARPAPESETPESQAPESQAPESQAKAAAPPALAAGDGMVITFATNSSYFPPGTSKQLRSLVRGMAAGERYKVVLQAGVSGSDKVVGASSPEEARRYNRWLAERRVERVQTWLSENAAGADLVIEPQFLPENEDRTVVVRIAPAA